MPASVTESVLAALAIGSGFFRRDRFWSASQWAAAQGAARWRRHRIALGLLANHGRFVGQELVPNAEFAQSARGHVVLQGEEHLRAATAGALLLGFHLGPPKSAFLLRDLGYPVRFAGRLVFEGRSYASLEPHSADATQMPGDRSHPRLSALYAIRNLLRDGGFVYMTADGPFGREAFNIDLAGRAMAIRVGWFTLRRLTRVPTLPILSHQVGKERVIVVHGPLPDPVSDAASDAAACKNALTPIIESYVREFPTQCRWLAMPRWSPISGAQTTR